jgi:hypothetical protein
MKRILLVLFVFLFSVFNLSAQTSDPDTSWKSGGFIGLNFSQVNLTDWSAGGENSMSIAANTNLFSNYVEGKIEWLNSLDLNYAMLRTSSQGLRKTDDRLELNSKYSKKFAEKWLYSALGNFKSQFAPGYNYPNDSVVISRFLAPAYLTLALGITYKPVDYFEVMFSPATAKFTFVNDDQLSDAGAFGVDPGKTVRSEFGAYLNMRFKKDIMTNVTLASRLELFNNYTDKDKDNAKKIDVNWESSITMKVNKYLTASVTAQLVYDANVVERTQYRQVLGIGLGYKF